MAGFLSVMTSKIGPSNKFKPTPIPIPKDFRRSISRNLSVKPRIFFSKMRFSVSNFTQKVKNENIKISLSERNEKTVFRGLILVG